MNTQTDKESSTRTNANRRPPFTITDWIVAAFSIVLLVYVLINLPPV